MSQKRNKMKLLRMGKNQFIILVFLSLILIAGISLITIGQVYQSFVEAGATTPLSDDVKSCEDSDDGIDFYAKGTVFRTKDGSSSEHTDYCLTPSDTVSELREFYCEGNTMKSIYINCVEYDMNCVDGACV